MTREEIESFVRKVIADDWDVERMVSKVTERWTEDRADARQEGFVAGQMSTWK